MTTMCKLHTNAKRIDPTQTTQLRKRFEADFRRRFAALAKEIRDVIANQNALGIHVNDMRFTFPTQAGKQAEFMGWLKSRVDFLIYDGTMALPRNVAVNKSWMNTYIQTSYRRGQAKAVADIRKAGGLVSPEYVEKAFLRPVHADRAGQIFTRSYESLQGITSEMDSQISRVLAEGMLDGRNPNVIARQLVDRVEKIGLTRARLLARTEVIAAHANAKLATYEDAGIQGVNLEAEWLTAGDDRVCEECQSLEDNGPYSLDQAKGMIPAHPNCRCSWVSVITDGKDIEVI